MWKLFELAVNFFQVVVIIQTITKYLGAKYFNIKGKILSLLATTILFCELNYINRRMTFEGLAIIIPISITFIYAMIALKGSWKKKLYCSVLVMVFIIGVTALVLNIVGILCGSSYVNLVEEQSNARIISLIIIQVLIFYTTRIFLLKREEDIGELSWDMWFITIVIPLISIIILAFLLEISINTNMAFRDDGLKMAIFASLGVFLTNILIYLMYIKLKKDTTERIEYELLKQRYKIQERNIEDIKQLYSRLRKVKHDVKHHLNLIKMLIEDNKNSEALNYLKKYSDSEYSLKQDDIFCENMILNYIINLKSRIMEQKGINFYCDVCGNVQGVTDVDLNIVLGNLLDNAIEACESVYGKDKEVILSIYIRTSYLVIIVKNTYTGDLNNLYQKHTSKENCNEHGFGLLSVKDVVEKYNGKLDIEHSDEQVIIRTILEIETK